MSPHVVQSAAFLTRFPRDRKSSPSRDDGEASAGTEAPTEKATPLAYDLEVQIRNGRLAPGDRVPSTKELSEKYGLARNAVLVAELDVLKRLDLIS